MYNVYMYIFTLLFIAMCTVDDNTRNFKTEMLSVNNLKNASQPNIPKLHFNYKSRVLSKFLGNEKFSAADLQAKSETSTHFGNQIL